MIHWLATHVVVGYNSQVVGALQNFAHAAATVYKAVDTFVRSAAQGYNGWSG